MVSGGVVHSGHGGHDGECEWPVLYGINIQLLVLHEIVRFVVVVWRK